MNNTHCDKCNIELPKVKVFGAEVKFSCISCGNFFYYLDDKSKNFKRIKITMNQFYEWGLFRVYCDVYKKTWTRLSWYTQKDRDINGNPIINLRKAFMDWQNNRDWNEIVNEWKLEHGIL